MTRKSFIWRDGFQYEFDAENDCWKFTHGTRFIKPKSWIELPSPPKPQGIQISVIIVNWNRPLNAVGSCIKSVLNQDFPAENFEVILVDDASDISPKPVCLEILKEYPNHNFRAYLLDRTRTWSCPHPYNVGLKRAVGWIVLVLQSECILDDTPERDLDDSYPKQPALEGVWRHHNARDRLGLIPRRLDQFGDKEYKYADWMRYLKEQGHEEVTVVAGGESYSLAKSFFAPTCPHDIGLSVRKCYAQGVRGYPENTLGDPVIDYLINLTTKCGIKLAEDLNMQVIHRDYMVPQYLYNDPYKVRSVTPGAPPSLDSWLSVKRPDWPEHWGELTEDEEKNAIRSQR